MKNEKKLLKAVLILLLALFANSQEVKAQVDVLDYSKNPHWIKMMNDPKANYHETIKAFDVFWKDRAKPVEEKEIFSKKEQYRELIGKQTKEASKYSFEYKKFMNWKRKALPFVQEDGSILSAEERLAIWSQQ